jgi:hypothetical protein
MTAQTGFAHQASTTASHADNCPELFGKCFSFSMLHPGLADFMIQMHLLGHRILLW